MAQHQLALPFEREEPYSYHDITRPGFFSVLVQQPSGTKQQHSHKLEAMPTVLRDVDPSLDTWISQCEFVKPNRKVVNLWRMPLMFVDLDTYKMPQLGALPAHARVYHLLEACEAACLPPPSIVVDSGRGLQAKWLLLKPLPRSALPRWQAVQTCLCQRLECLGADMAARDASRVLRLVDTVNSKGGHRVQVVHQTSISTAGAIKLDSGLVVHDFEVLANTVLPTERADVEAQRRARKAQQETLSAEKALRDARRAQLTVIERQREGRNKNLRPFVSSELAWQRLEDVRKLANLRGWTEGAPAGARDVPMFLCACFLAQAVIVPNVMGELIELARQFAPSWTDVQIKSCASTVYTRAHAAARGERVEFNGTLVDPRYRFRNATLIELLEITADEQRAMKTIISETEAKRRDAERHRERRRAAGQQCRDEYLQCAQAKREQARHMRAAGTSWKEIARTLGYASADAARKSVQ